MISVSGREWKEEKVSNRSVEKIEQDLYYEPQYHTGFQHYFYYLKLIHLNNLFL